MNFDISSLGTDETLETLSFEKIPSATVTVDRGVTLADALKKAVTESNGALTITGLDSDSGYITKINQVEGYNGNEDSNFVKMLNGFGVTDIPTAVFQYAGWMYSGNGLSGYGTKVDTIEQDTTVNFRYTLYYGAASSTEWRNFDWDFIDAYNLLTEKINAAQGIANGGYSGFSEEQKSILNEKLETAKTVRQGIDDEADGIWAYYIAEKGTTLWGPGSPTDNLKNAYDELDDAINKVPTPTEIVITGLKNGSENLDFASTTTLYVGDTIKLLTVVLPEGSRQDVVYDTLVGDKAISITKDGVITCQAEANLVMIQVKSERVPSIMKTIMLKIVPAPTYTATFTGIDGLELTDGSVSVRQGQTVYTGTFSDGKVSFGGLKKGEYDYSAVSGDFQESGKLIVSDSDVDVSVSGKNPKTQADTLLDNIAKSYVNKSDDWRIMEMAAYARYNPNTAYKTSSDAKQNYINTVTTAIDSGKTAYGNISDTDIDKAIIALTSIGGDATKIYRVNDNTPISAVEKLNSINKSTSAWRAPYTLAAYNQKEYATESYEESLINALLTAQKDEGCWDEYNMPIDSTANVIAGLSFYKDRDDVSRAIEKGISYLSGQQKPSGAFDGGYGVNSNSTAMVVVALAAVGVNPDTDARFIKNGNSVLDGLLSFALMDNSGFGYQDNTTLDMSATEQSFRALIAASQIMTTGDAYNIYDFSGNEVSPVRETGSGTVTKPDESTGDNITVKFTIKADTGYWLNNYSVTIPGTGATVYHAFVKACEAAGITYVGAENGYARSMTKAGRTLSEFTNGPDSGWMYKVNDVLVKVGLTSCGIKDGDDIVWFYTDDWKTVPGALDYMQTDQSSVTTTGTSGSAATTAPTEVTVSGSTATATVKSENAAEAIKQAKENKSAEIVLNVAASDTKGAETVKVQLDTATVKSVVSDTDASLTVKTENGQVSLDREALTAVASEAKGATITLEVVTVSKPTETQQKAAGTNGQVLQLTVKSGDKTISDFNKGKATVTVEISEGLKDKKVAAIYIAEDGKIEQLSGKTVKIDGKKYYTFGTPHFSVFALVDAEELGLEVNDEEQAKMEKLIAGVENTTLKASSKKVASGIKITWTKSKGYRMDYYEVFRSTKRYSGFGKVAFYTTKNAKNPSKTCYVNTEKLKEGTRYYYKVRGVRILDGKKYYTQWSTKVWRVA